MAAKGKEVRFDAAPRTRRAALSAVGRRNSSSAATSCPGKASNEGTMAAVRQRLASLYRRKAPRSESVMSVPVDQRCVSTLGLNDSGVGPDGNTKHKNNTFHGEYHHSRTPKIGGARKRAGTNNTDDGSCSVGKPAAPLTPILEPTRREHSGSLVFPPTPEEAATYSEYSGGGPERRLYRGMHNYAFIGKAETGTGGRIKNKVGSVFRRLAQSVCGTGGGAK